MATPDVGGHTMLAELAQIGQFLGGIGFVATAVIAAITLFTINKKQINDSWLDRFRNLYGEFWKDEDMAFGRKMIVNDENYRELELALKKRNEQSTCAVSSQEYDLLEKIDRFCSVLVRIRTFGESKMNPMQRDLWSKLLYAKFWFDKIESRVELKKYIDKHWSEVSNKTTNTFK